jgi:Na+-translocating ferredoxin:NAD+ oxidoreductase RNF subunit RnfB
MEQIEETAKFLPGLDCGSCGSPNCHTLAEDIVLGKAQMLDCVFKLREEVSKLAQDLLKLSQRLPPAMGINNQDAGGEK